MKDDCCAPKGNFDLAVIGAGSAGFSAAITAAAAKQPGLHETIAAARPDQQRRLALREPSLFVGSF